MNANEMLDQVREIEYEMDVLKNARAAAWAHAVKTTTTLGKTAVKDTPEPHKYDELAIFDDEITQKMAALAAAKTAALRAIYSLDNPRFREVLGAYYVDSRTAEGRRKTWNDVADQLFLSLRAVKYAQKMAVSALELAYASKDHPVEGGEGPLPTG